MPTLFEFKAKSDRNNELEEKLQSLNPVFVGEDHQTDTYFNVPEGRLKLREGIIENALIFYKRSDTANAKQSDVLVYHPERGLKEVLTAALGVKIVVEKRRRIWLVNNVKIHFDKVKGLGEFVEVEAIGEGNIPTEKLKEQCGELVNFFAIKDRDYVAGSYSDLLIKML